jgi:hypothetical protein
VAVFEPSTEAMDWRKWNLIDPAGVSQYRNDAFISSHRSDTPVTVALQKALHQLARPLLRRRALSVVRDKTSLGSNSGLWTSIEESLGVSRYFVLIASPGSSGSPWCRRR